MTGEVASTEDEPFEQQYIEAEQQVFADIADTEYLLDGLTTGECYRWEVQALGGDMTSRWSDEHRLIVSADYVPTAIGKVESARTIENENGYAIYNIKGTRVSDLNQPGVYIVKSSSTISKVIIK